jgi:hypothetical protein
MPRLHATPPAARLHPDSLGAVAMTPPGSTPLPGRCCCNTAAPWHPASSASAPWAPTGRARRCFLSGSARQCGCCLCYAARLVSLLRFPPICCHRAAAAGLSEWTPGRDIARRRESSRPEPRGRTAAWWPQPRWNRGPTESRRIRSFNGKNKEKKGIPSRPLACDKEDTQSFIRE